LTQEVVISAKNTKGLGKMIDLIVKQGGSFVTLTDFVWKPEQVAIHLIQESDPEVSALKEGIQQGK
jgi:translation initiation factor IF-2